MLKMYGLAADMPRYPGKVKERAMQIYDACHCDISMATTQMRQEFPQFTRNQLTKCIRYWWKHFLTRFSVKSDPGRASGRKQKIPRDVVLKAATAFKAGYYSDKHQQRVGYRTIKEACANNEVLQQILAEYNVGPYHVLRRIKDEDPDVAYAGIIYKCLLSATIKTKRQATAEMLRQVPVNVLERVFWLDAKKLYINAPPKGRVWGSKKDGRVLFEDKHLYSGKKALVLYYYVVVNAIFGAVKIIFCTGTTSIHDEGHKEYEVREGVLCQLSAGYTLCHHVSSYTLLPCTIILLLN